MFFYFICDFSSPRRSESQLPKPVHQPYAFLRSQKRNKIDAVKAGITSAEKAVVELEATVATLSASKGESVCVLVPTLPGPQIFHSVQIVSQDDRMARLTRLAELEAESALLASQVFFPTYSPLPLSSDWSFLSL